MTVRELYREFAAAKLRREDEVESVTLGAYQTVRAWVLTKNKKKMPNFKDLIPSSRPRAVVQGPEKSMALLEVLAARTGGKVRPRTDRG